MRTLRSQHPALTGLVWLALTAVTGCAGDSLTEPAEAVDPGSIAAARTHNRFRIVTPRDVTISCVQGFEMRRVGTINEHITEIFDGDGNFFMVKGLVQGHITWTNLSTGFALEDRFAFPFTIDFRTRIIETDRGNFANIKDPEAGIHLQENGVLRFDAETFEILFVAGKHEFLLGSTFDIMCEALAQPA